MKFYEPVVSPPVNLTPTFDDAERLRLAFAQRSRLEGRAFEPPGPSSRLRPVWSTVGFREVVVLIDSTKVRIPLSVAAANRFDPHGYQARYRPIAAEVLEQLLHPDDRALVCEPAHLAGWRDRAELTAYPSATISGLMLVDVGLVAATDARSLEADAAQRVRLPAAADWVPTPYVTVTARPRSTAADPAPDPYSFMAARRLPPPDPARVARDAAVGRAVGACPGRYGLLLPGGPR